MQIDLVGARPEPAQVCNAFHADEGESDLLEHRCESNRTSLILREPVLGRNDKTALNKGSQNLRR